MWCVLLLQVQRREETIARLKKQSLELQEVISRHEEMASQQALSQEQLQAQVKSLTAQLSTTSEGRQSVETELAELQKRCSGYQSNIAELETQISDLNHELSSSRVQAETLMAKVITPSLCCMSCGTVIPWSMSFEVLAEVWRRATGHECQVLVAWCRSSQQRI